MSSVIKDLYDTGLNGVESFIKIVGRSPNINEENNLEKAIAIRILNKIETGLPIKIDKSKLFDDKFAGLRQVIIAHYSIIFYILDNTITVLHISVVNEVNTLK